MPEDLTPPSLLPLIPLVKEIADILAIKQPSPLQEITWPNFANTRVLIKRDDLLHPIISGNKWRKLQYSLAHAIHTKRSHILSFGGGFSNHVHAIAYACHRLKLQLTLVIRGHYQHSMTPSLLDAKSWGAQLHFVDKTEYKRRHESDYIKQNMYRFGADYHIPEGGSNALALPGIVEGIDEIFAITQPDVIICPVGSAGTLAGIISASAKAQRTIDVFGVSVLNAGDSHLQQLQHLIPQHLRSKHWKILDKFAHGGYAKSSAALENFTHAFMSQTKIELDPVYNAKSFYAVNHLLSKNILSSSQSICLLQSGGNQGRRELK